MSTLKEKAQEILNEKNEKIIPENIKKDVQIFDIVGTLESGGSTPSYLDISTTNHIKVHLKELADLMSAQLTTAEKEKIIDIHGSGENFLSTSDDFILKQYSGNENKDYLTSLLFGINNQKLYFYSPAPGGLAYLCNNIADLDSCGGLPSPCRVIDFIYAIHALEENPIITFSYNVRLYSLNRLVVYPTDYSSALIDLTECPLLEIVD